MSDPFTRSDLAEKRRYIASRADRDHWGAAELSHIDHEARWVATVDALVEALDGQRHNEQAIRSLQAENADLRASIGEVVAERDRLRDAARVAVEYLNVMRRSFPEKVGCRLCGAGPESDHTPDCELVAARAALGQEEEGHDGR